jgi:hypothetical protein
VSVAERRIGKVETGRNIWGGSFYKESPEKPKRKTNSASQHTSHLPQTTTYKFESP